VAAQRDRLVSGTIRVEMPAGGAPILSLRGEVDLASVDAFRTQLDALAERSSSVVVDMADTTFIDGSVLGVLAGAGARFPDGVVVKGATGMVAKVFRLANMEHLLAE
jgi:anti-anti-sigma factor